MTRFDFSQPPFDCLTPGERQQLEAAADIVFFAEDAEVMAPGQPVDTLYIVIKGIVREMNGDELIAVFRERDTFDSRALIAGETRHRFFVHEQTLAFALPRAAVLALTEQNTRFGAFFYAGVASKLDAMSQQSGNRETQTLLTARVGDLSLRAALRLDAHATVLDAACAMKRHKVKSLLVSRGGETGIFTVSDFRDIIINGTDTAMPLAGLAHWPVIACRRDDYLFDALLTMTRHNIQRLAVVDDDGAAVDILEQVDLLAYFSNHSHLIAQRLERAENLDELEAAAAQITRLVQILAGSGLAVSPLGRLLQALNARLFERTWRLLAPPALYGASCLLVMGSEGRGEQLLKTDQDNALILRDGNGIDASAVVTATSAFSDALTRFGYPPCPGGVMLYRPEWRLEVGAWRERIRRWVYAPDGEAMMQLAIFVDAQPVAGDASLLAECRRYLETCMRDDSAWFSRFARAVEQFDTPLGLFAQLLTREQDGRATIDLKKGGIFAIVHGARALALETGLAESNTFDRLQGLVRQGVLEAELGADLAEALAFMLKLRLTQGLAAIERGKPSGNLIVASELSSLERDLLKEALAVVKRFRALLRHHFHLASF
ncbi:putative nucleotidyltransferase substrate binding domain-containing protein [Paludibacterium yongneupense]|uniref:putative nucleotidyltransferase substrate binding domain-containing protein n=1 Tax=Paludibacterium yongneupense TaxID=400061 RepID=UPI00040CBE0C|nr:putative nucleotidyltransferase substrate binding domain-containing protein [Paludibacterium yongneupense]